MARSSLWLVKNSNRPKSQIISVVHQNLKTAQIGYDVTFGQLSQKKVETESDVIVKSGLFLSFNILLTTIF